MISQKIREKFAIRRSKYTFCLVGFLTSSSTTRLDRGQSKYTKLISKLKYRKMFQWPFLVHKAMGPSTHTKKTIVAAVWFDLHLHPDSKSLVQCNIVVTTNSLSRIKLRLKVWEVGVTIKVKLNNSNLKANFGITTRLYGRFYTYYNKEAINPFFRFFEIRQYCAEPA